MVLIKIADKFATYPCGCKFEVCDTDPVRIKFDPRVENMPLNCPSTWRIIGDGNTKGVFQLETRFGQQYAKILKPENIEQLAALTAIMRPGCIQATRDDKNIAEHYMDRKNGLEEVTYFHPALKPILKETYGEMIYQEQVMKIAQEIAGFNLQQADILRKAMGKKKADIMAKVKIEFLEGCNKSGIVDNDMASEIFGWIEKSQRYLFNKSHSISYAFTAYSSAYEKVHFNNSFFTSNLFYAKDKQKRFDEVKLLVANARMMNINICPPDFRHTNSHFKNINRKIYFGFADIKGVGKSSMSKLNTAIYQIETATNKCRTDWSWVEFLIFFSQEITSTTITGIIESGAVDYFGTSRQKMLFEFEQYSKLTIKEQTWIRQHITMSDFNSLSDVLHRMMQWYDSDNTYDDDVPKPCANKNRIVKINSTVSLLNNPPYSLVDSPEWIASVEDSRLGIAITASILDSCKNAVDQANCTCIDYIKHNEPNSGVFIAVQIDEIRTYITKNGDEMVFIVISDNNASIDAVIFPESWGSIRLSGICIPENTVIVSGERTQKGSLSIKKMWQLT